MTLIEAVQKARAVKSIKPPPPCIRRMSWEPGIFIDVWSEGDLDLCWTDVLADDWELIPDPEYQEGV